jgi:hypothetical protein
MLLQTARVHIADQIMFYSRPNLRPLGIDLVDIQGGGACPAQFWGQTADGQPVYIRYRGGRFSVDCGERCLIDESIGPSLHGSMLLEQACDLAGLTLRGECLMLSEEKSRAAAKEEPILDWSGRTTYWVRDLQVTQKGGLKFVDALARHLPDFVLLGRRGETLAGGEFQEMLTQCTDGVLLASGADPLRLAALRSSDQVLRADLKAAFAHVVDLGFSWNHPASPDVGGYRVIDSVPTIAPNLGRRPLPNFFDQIRREVYIADYWGRLRGRLWAEFATADPKAKVFIESVIEVANECFSNRVETVDLLTGDITGTIEHRLWHSIDLREWSRAGPDRYLGFFDEGIGDAARHLGFRPAIPVVADSS